MPRAGSRLRSAAAATLTSRLLLLLCWISRAPRGLADASPPTAPFFGGATSLAVAGSEPQSRLRTEMADELLLMAIGRHSYFLDGLMRPQLYGADSVDYEATDRAQHTQAAIALHLLQQLRFMEAMDEKLTAAASETTGSVLEYRTAMQVFFETLLRKVEQDGATLAAFMEAEADVRSWYQRLPATRRRYAAVRTVATSTLLRLLGRQSAFVRGLAICTLFLETARAADEQRYSKLSRNVLRLARNGDAAPHIERIFQAAVRETAEATADADDSQRTLDILFQKLVDKMRADAQLNSRSTRAKICVR